MNKRTFTMAAVACIALFSKTMAQEPLVHIVTFPQGDAAWSVKAQNQQSPTAQQPAGTQPTPKNAKTFQGLDIVRQGKLRRDVVTWSDGSTEQMWWIQDLPVVLADRGGRVDCLKSADMGQVRFDDSSFAWVSAKSYLGKKLYQGQDSQYYEMKVVNPGAPDAPPITMRAWIDPLTHQPLALFNGYLEVAFSFPKDAKVPPLQMPSNFQEMYTRLQDFYAHVKQSGT